MLEGDDMTNADLSCFCPIATLNAEETLCLSALMKWKVTHKGKPTLILNGDVTNRKTQDSTQYTTLLVTKILVSTSVQLCQNRMKYHDRYAHAQYEIFIKNIKSSIKLF